MATISSLDRGLDVLEAIVRHAHGVGTRALAKELGMSVTSVHNMASTLVQRGYLAQDDRTRQFHPGPHLALLSRASSLADDLTRAAMPLLRAAADSSGESVMLGGIVGARIVRLAFLAASQTLSVREPENFGDIAHCTAVGKVLLATMAAPDLAAFLRAAPPRRFTEHTIHKPADLRAELERVRTQGFARVVDEFADGVSALGVSVPGSEAILPAAIGISAPSVRYDAALQKRVMGILTDTAAGIGEVWARHAPRNRLSEQLTA